PVRGAVNHFDSDTKSLMQGANQPLPRADGLGGSHRAKGHDNHLTHEAVYHSIVFGSHLCDDANALVELLRSVRRNDREDEINSTRAKLFGFSCRPIKHLLNILSAEMLAKLPAQFAPSEKI